jgi:hypothetical protein
MLAGELLRDFVARLDDEKRAVFVLAELEGMTGSEIAEVLAINPNTASSRLRAARQAFAEHFDHRDTRRRVERAARRAREQPEQPPRGASQRMLALVLAGPAQVFGSTGVIAIGIGKLGLGSLLVTASVALVASVGFARPPASQPERGSASASSRVADSSPSGSRSHEGAAMEIVAVRPATDLQQAFRPAPVSAFDEEPIAESLARARPRAAASGDALPDLAGYEALRAAREHLVAREPEAALALLDGLDVHEGPLGEARAATRIAALCQLDRGGEAEATWSTLHASSPTSAVVDRLRDACWSKR